MLRSTLMLSVVLSLLVCHPAFSQDWEANNPFSDKMINVLFSGKVGKQLDLVEEQVVEMKSLMKDLRQAREELGMELKQLAQETSEAELENLRVEFQQEFDSKKKATMTIIREVLLPEQLERLGQITAQLMLKEAAKKTGLGILAPEMIELLEISEEQQARLKEKGEQLQRKIAEEYQRMIEEAKEELLDELSDEQAKKYKQLIGDPMDQ